MASQLTKQEWTDACFDQVENKYFHRWNENNEQEKRAELKFLHCDAVTATDNNEERCEEASLSITL